MSDAAWVGNQLFEAANKLEKIDSRILHIRIILSSPDFNLAPEYARKLEAELTDLYTKFSAGHIERKHLLEAAEDNWRGEVLGTMREMAISAEKEKADYEKDVKKLSKQLISSEKKRKAVNKEINFVNKEYAKREGMVERLQELVRNKDTDYDVYVHFFNEIRRISKNKTQDGVTTKAIHEAVQKLGSKK